MLPTEKASLAAIVAFGFPALLASESAAQETHGAMPMDAQLEAIPELLVERDITEPPPTVDPFIWSTVVIPENNALTSERVALGRKLYFDTRLSSDGTVACATCHDVSRGFTDQRPLAEGVRGQLGRRNSPTTMNAFLFQTLFLDGRAPSLEEQAKLPIVNPIEMGQPDQEAAVAAIADDPGYRRMFEAAYGREPNFEDLARAIASFERTLVFLDAPFDDFLAGDEGAISESAARGWALFNGKARCAGCHAINASNPLGTDNRFHNIGVSARHQDFEELAREALEILAKDDDPEAIDKLAIETDLSELGRFLVSKNYADIGAFKTSQLRNVGVTGPYMHDGSMQTLWDVMDHYNKGGEPNAFLDGGIEPLALTEQEVDDLVAFMFTLTDRRFAEQNETLLAGQQERARERRPFRDDALAQREVLPFERRVAGIEAPPQPAPPTPEALEGRQ